MHLKGVVILFIIFFFSPFIILAAVIGDHNGDRKIDGPDYIAWLNNFNKQTTQGNVEGDYDLSNNVDIEDYDLWLSKYDTLIDQDWKFSVLVGEEEIAFKPNDIPSSFFDASFLTLKVPGGVRAFITQGGGNTISLFGPDINNLNYEGVSLSKGSPGNFDECGAWLKGIYPLSATHILGWYYSEEKCNYTAEVWTWRGSVAFVESFDGGKTWQKPNYPNNQTITNENSFNNDTTKDDVSGGRVINDGQYLYIFSNQSSDNQTFVARSKISDQGRPGTWFKFHNTSFTEPGIGGKTSSIPALSAQVNIIYNSFLNRYMDSNATGRYGFYLYFSNLSSSIIDWTAYPSINGSPSKAIYPRITDYNDMTVDEEKPVDVTTNQAIYWSHYGSTIGLDGSSDDVGKEFYQYYVKVFKGQNAATPRYLMRRKLTLSTSLSGNEYAYLQLISYKKDNKTIATTEVLPVEKGYQKENTLGYILPYDSDNFVSLYLCHVSFSDSYFITTVDASQNNYQYCETQGQYGDTFVRRIGYISQNPDNNKIHLYRCLDETSSLNFVSINEDCEGKKKLSLLGYIFKKEYVEPFFN